MTMLCGMKSAFLSVSCTGFPASTTNQRTSKSICSGSVPMVMVCTPLSRRSRRIEAAERSGSAVAVVLASAGAFAVVVLFFASPSSVVIDC